MLRHRFSLLMTLGALVLTPVGLPAQAGSPPPPAAATADEAARTATNNAAAAIASREKAAVRTPEFVELLADEALGLFDVETSGNSAARYAISLLLVVVAIISRRLVTGFGFGRLRNLAARSQTTLDDKLLSALEAPAGTFVLLVGLFAALKVLKLSVSADEVLGYASTVAFSLALFWTLLRACNALLDHVHEIAVEKKLGVAAFMPWIKKTLVVVFVIFGVLLTAQSLGADVRAFLAGLGLGGLAFALAAQDTIANVFGSIVVAIDQPFKLGEVVKIGVHTGTVEDIGLRSTKIRLTDRSLVIIPNKTVAAEAVINLSRFTERRIEQIVPLRPETPAEQVEGLLADLRELIRKEKTVDPASVVVTFANVSPTTIDVSVACSTKGPDAAASVELKERINLGILRILSTRQIGFGVPAVVAAPAAPPPVSGPTKKS